MAIPGISTGGGGLSNSSSAAAQGGRVTGGARSFSFSGPNINQGPDIKTVAIYGGLMLAAYLVYKGVRRG